MKYQLEQDNQTVQPVVVYRSNPYYLTSTADLLQQGLALADQLDDAIANGGVQQAHSPELDVSDHDSILDNGQTPTVLQPESALNRSSKSTLLQSPQSDEDPSWAQVWLQRGFSKLKQANLLGAQDNFERALQKNPQCIEAWNGLGVTHFRLAQGANAVTAFREALRLDPTNASLHCNLGSAFYLLRDFLNAIASFQKSARLNPKDVLAYYGLGVSLLHLQDYSKAIASFQRAVALDGHHANSFYALGYAHYCVGDLPAAIAALGKAKQREPKYAPRYEVFLRHCLQDSLETR
ncbi:MAG: tetratricopeptide repeat protein [Thermosynechococcaceae cyanobacterium]